MSDKKDKRELFDILDEALDRALQGEDIHDILADYPRYAEELEPLLKTALDTRNAAAIKPRPEFRARAAVEFQKAIQDMPVKAKTYQPVRRWRLGIVVLLAALLVVLLAGTGTVAAANFSLPDSPLYGVKLATESVQLALTPTDAGKAALYAKFNDRRVDELVWMAAKGDSNQVEILTGRINSNMDNISRLTGGGAVQNAATFGVMSSAGSPAPVSAPNPTPENRATKNDHVTLAAPTTTAVMAPTSTTTQAVTITTTPTPLSTLITVPPQAEGSGGPKHGGQQSNNANNSKNQKLQKVLSDKQMTELEALQKAYDAAPDWLKPEIQAAIDAVLNGYDVSISNLSQ